jgi:tRNA pseudouridine55 synthase
MDGIIIIDKPKKLTSHDVVDIARKSIGTKRIGHIGTLDPNATGVLVLCVGRATKLVKYFTGHRKTYCGRFIVGEEYDTDDTTGKLTNKLDASNIKESELREVIENFAGKQLQTPPNYSAIKHEGRKLYELARRDIKLPNVEPREIEVLDISNIKILSMGEKIVYELEIEVTKGTYIRAIARDVGRKLGNFGCLDELRRTAINLFKIEESFSIEQLKNNEVEIMNPFDYLDLPRIYVDERVTAYIENGRFLDLDLFPEKTDTIIYSNEGNVLAIYYYDEIKNLMRMSVKWC